VESECFRALDAALERALEPIRAGSAPLTLLFSGGVDSSLLAWELRSRQDLTLFTVGAAGSRDLSAASSASRLIGPPWSSARVGPAEVARTTEALADVLGDFDRVARAVLVALGVALERSPSRRTIAGQGIDELFLGYAHFRDLGREEAGARADADLRRLLDRDWPATIEIARRFGREIIAPYLEPEFRAAARSVPLEWRLPRSAPKAFFRRWAVHRGLPAELAARPKRAFQYGSGIARWVPSRPG